MPAEADRFLLRRYHAAKARGDADAAAEAWDRLAEQNWDRIVQTVKLFRFSKASRGIPAFDQGSAASLAYLRVRALGGDFHSHAIEAYYAAVVHTTQFACRDFGRREFRHTRRAAGSLDQRWDAGSETGPYSNALAKWDEARHEEAAEHVREELEQEHKDSLIAWAIGRIDNAKHREVLEMTYNDKLTTDEIAARLGISKDNAYQRRSRGVRELKKVLDDPRT